MLNAIGFVIKLFIFSALILVGGNWLSWEGRSLNSHLQTQLHHMDRSDLVSQVRDWTHRITDDARQGFEKKNAHRTHSHAVVGKNNSRLVATKSEMQSDAESSDTTETASSAPAPVSTRAHAELQASAGEQIPSSERQKLRALIRELNSSQDKH
jgi:septum formation inhibitor MinC